MRPRISMLHRTEGGTRVASSMTNPVRLVLPAVSHLLVCDCWLILDQSKQSTRFLSLQQFLDTFPGSNQRGNMLPVAASAVALRSLCQQCFGDVRSHFSSSFTHRHRQNLRNMAGFSAPHNSLSLHISSLAFASKMATHNCASRH